uniref:Uncharacterized protein n=1 Tax=Arundo donax TaxID=35708 RepID=A0A0A9CZH9_ARUDO
MQCNLDHIESAHHIDNHMLLRKSEQTDLIPHSDQQQEDEERRDFNSHLTQLLHELQHIRHHTLRGAVRVPLTSKSARTPAFFLIPNGSRGLVARSTAPRVRTPLRPWERVHGDGDARADGGSAA